MRNGYITVRLKDFITAKRITKIKNETPYHIYISHDICSLLFAENNKKVYLPSYRIIHSSFLRTLNNIAVRHNQNNSNVFIVYLQSDCKVFVWMLDKRHVMYDPDTFGYTTVGKHIFFLQKDKSKTS